MTVQERLQRLREKMKENGITVYVVPSSDCHESEYVSAHYRAREYMTGFTGSAGTAVVTMNEAGLWTDGRYFVQAKEQLAGSGVTLYRMGEPDVPTVEAYVQNRLEGGGTLGFDGRTMGARRAEKLAQAASGQGARLLVSKDLVGEIWEDRPPVADAKVRLLDPAVTGESTEDKLKRVRTAMKEAGADVHVLASLCDIAWILNIRGGDIPCVPVVLSYLLLTADQCRWYVRPSVVTDKLRAYMEENGVGIRDYDGIYADLERTEPGQKMLLDKKNVNYRLLNSLPVGTEVVDKSNPSELMKAVKNDTELSNLRAAHLKEGVAFTKFMYWLKTRAGKEEITERSAAAYLEKLRKEQGGYLGHSFDPICAYGAHAAIVHYSATEQSDIPIRPEGFLLLDAGGHYEQGTTDTTRTFALGNISEEQKRMFTAVLRGSLNLAYARFLHGCSGYSLDILCREPLWQMGVDFKHGTGHGVGYLLNVHEGPNAIRWKIPEGEVPAVLEPGMVTSDEPGVYIEGQYGIRTENEIVCAADEKNEYGQFLRFEILTLTPVDLDAVLPQEMTARERDRLNDYHKKVYETLSSHLSEDERKWLKRYTRAV